MPRYEARTVRRYDHHHEEHRDELVIFDGGERMAIAYDSTLAFEIADMLNNREDFRKWKRKPRDA